MTGMRVLVTNADVYMGPEIVKLFTAEGAEVIASTEDLSEPGTAARIVGESGAVDALIANLAERELQWDLVHEIRDEDWGAFFDDIVHPLMELTRAVLPRMIERKSGKIVAITSAAPLRGIAKASAYCAARGAQNAFVRAAGLEVARHNVQINAIAQNYIENPTYYSEDMLADEKLMERMLKAIPARRLGKGSETAELALFLSTDACNFMVGQVIPFAGGWATTTG